MPWLVCVCVICKPPKTGFLASRPNISRIYTSKRKFIKMLHKDQCSNSVTTEFGVNKLIFTLMFSKVHVINILMYDYVFRIIMKTSTLSVICVFMTLAMALSVYGMGGYGYSGYYAPYQGGQQSNPLGVGQGGICKYMFIYLFV